jgi:acyl-[acyl-carrier-protein]-phospholipid O-acyltransferase/long-chain-fatty-acid--[acyl-carrier-protein] ligase
VTIAKAIAKPQATLYCTTSTFLRLFNQNRRIHRLMLDSLRVVVAGAERLNPEVRDAFKLKFNKEIYEGYGTTETTPVASCNIPDRIDPSNWKVQQGNKPGTVGMPLPGGSFRIADPVTLKILPTGEDGLVLFSGPQVMLGYLNAPEKTADVIVQLDDKRWYKTGDKGHLDQDGFLTIVDRYSRFAKIGGEMISLGAIENTIGKLLPENIEVLTTAIPDGKKGEKVILLIAGDIGHDEIKGLIKQSGLNPLMRPAELINVKAIPRLGSGKNDFSRAKQIALEALT